MIDSYLKSETEWQLSTAIQVTKQHYVIITLTFNKDWVKKYNYARNSTNSESELEIIQLCSTVV